jgi:hypothetical protein
VERLYYFPSGPLTTWVAPPKINIQDRTFATNLQLKRRTFVSSSTSHLLTCYLLVSDVRLLAQVARQEQPNIPSLVSNNKREQVPPYPNHHRSNKSMRPQSYVPMVPQPVQAVRKLLRSLRKGLARDEELRTLHITVSELLSSPVASSSAEIPKTITNFFQTKLYQAEMRCLNIAGFHKTPKKSRSCGAWISSLLVSWTDIIAISAGSKVRILRYIILTITKVPTMLILNRNHRLHIATHSYTKGVLSTLMIVSETDALQRPRLLFIPRRHAMGKELTHVELYALLAVALKEYHGQQMVEEVKLLLSLEIQETDISTRLPYFLHTPIGCNASPRPFLRHTFGRY